MLAACGTGGSSPASSKPTASAASVAVPTAAPSPTPASTPTPEGEVYTVKSGDTLSRIATQNNSSVEAIVRANNLTDPDKLQVGQKLTIPGGAAPSASASTGGLPAAASKPPPP